MARKLKNGIIYGGKKEKIRNLNKCIKHIIIKEVMDLMMIKEKVKKSDSG